MRYISFKLAFMAVVLALAGTTFTACEDDIEITNGITNPWGNVDGIIRKTKCSGISEQNVPFPKRNVPL